MANLPKDFIGLDALQHVAEEVSKEIVMGPGYSDAEEMDRLGIDIVTGVQFKRTFHLFIRKGGTTRRKDVHREVNSEAGFLKERTLVAKLAWDKFPGNIDDFCETVFGTDAQGQFPLSSQAVEAILKDYADNLAANLWFGNIALDNGDDSVPASDQAMALYNGFHTCIQQDIEDGLISEANGNLIHCDAITAPVDKDDSSPYDIFIAWYMKWDERLRKVPTRVYMNETTAMNIASGYANKFHGNFRVEYNQGDNFKLPGLSKVSLCPISGFGEGDRMYATIDKNFVYGVDTKSNQQYVSVRLGSDRDHRDLSFQIQSIQGSGIKSFLRSALAVSDGTLVAPEYVAGDYDNTKLVVTLAGTDGQKPDGTVKVNSTAYTKPLDTTPNQILTLEAADGTNYKFDSWSNGKKDKKIQLTATGMNMGITAFFKKNGE
jgi:hypothetical protein